MRHRAAILPIHHSAEVRLAVTFPRWLLLALVLSPMAPAADTAASVRFDVFALDGVTRPQYRVHEFYNKAAKIDLSSRFKATLRGVNIPFGVYTYTLIRADVNKPSATTLRGTANIFQLRQRISLAAPATVGVDSAGREFIFDDFGEANTLTGKYVGLSPADLDSLWARLYNPVSGQSAEVELDRDGAFSFASCPPGRNVLLLMKESSILQADPIASDPPFGRKIKVTLVRH